MFSLQEIQQYYATNLENKTFRYTLRGGQILELRFYQQSLCHLLGIQHIMHHNKKFIGLSGYQKIQAGTLTLDTLRKRDALQYKQMYHRMQELHKLGEVLQRGAMYRFYILRQPRTKIKADYLLYWCNAEQLYHNLFLAKEKSLLPARQTDNSYSAISYVVMTEKDNHDMYIEQQEYKQILKFEVIEKTH